jgi:hypothetical protein
MFPFFFEKLTLSSSSQYTDHCGHRTQFVPQITVRNGSGSAISLVRCGSIFFPVLFRLCVSDRIKVPFSNLSF